MIVPYFPLAVTVLVGAAFVCAVVVSTRVRMLAAPAPIDIDPAHREAAQRRIRTARTTVTLSTVVGLAVAAVAGVVLGAFTAAMSNLGQPFGYLQYGPPAVFGPLLSFVPLVGVAAAAVVLSIYGHGRGRARGRQRERNRMRTADLEVRQPDAALRKLLIALAASVVGLVLFLLSTGLTESSDLGGMSSRFIVVSGSATNEGSYPGWALGVPIAASALIMLALVFAALARVHYAPGSGVGELRAVDAAVRGGLSRFIILLGIAAALLALGTVMWSAGATTSVASVFPIMGKCVALGNQSSICQAIRVTFSQPTFGIGALEAAVGTALTAGALALIAGAVHQARVLIRIRAAARLVAA
ncbi:MAG TPA: hypothetical protein VIJ18_12765 [Microbacteriaceae bacterium]